MRKIIFLLLITITSSMLTVGQSTNSKITTKKRKAKLVALTNVNYVVSGPLPKLKQPTDNTCWATAATMMASWKDKKNYSINELMAKAGKDYLEKFTSDDGLGGAEKILFLQSLNLQAETPQSYTIQGWLSLLKKYGPLWITTNEGTDENFAVHARILKGISGDSSNDATFFTFIDPADGREHSENFTNFIKKFEDIAIKDSKSGDLRPQIVHY